MKDFEGSKMIVVKVLVWLPYIAYTPGVLRVPVSVTVYWPSSFALDDWTVYAGVAALSTMAVVAGEEVEVYVIVPQLVGSTSVQAVTELEAAD